jgi:hypothetical protein
VNAERTPTCPKCHGTQIQHGSPPPAGELALQCPYCIAGEPEPDTRVSLADVAAVQKEFDAMYGAGVIDVAAGPDRSVIAFVRHGEMPPEGIRGFASAKSTPKLPIRFKGYDVREPDLAPDYKQYNRHERRKAAAQARRRKR